MGKTSVAQIRTSSGYPVATFRQLLDEVAFVTINNRNFEMFFRGQREDHKDRLKKTKIYPSIFRPLPGKKAVTRSLLEKRHYELHALINGARADQGLIEKYSNDPFISFDEFHIAQFQHYGIVETPFIDITQSLRVAASFALRNSQEGYLYVFGLPYPNGSISHFIDQQIVLVKLQNVSPVDAYRPRYQEGYLVGKFPITASKEAGDNLARRMIAKFKLENSNGKFWDPDFTQIKDEILFPENDQHEIFLENLKRNTLPEFSAKR
ncbi:FRG domain-containing protein [Chryseolinea soli]|nr:FRG domain-containing protein [Chryseolinea soli]